MSRKLSLAALVLALVAPSAAAAKRPRCSLSGHNLAHSRQIKVVKREAQDDYLRLLGCVRPDGRVRVLVDLEENFTTSASASLLGVGGTWVLLQTSSGNQYGGGLGVRAVDVRTGRAYTVASNSYMIGGPTTGTAVEAAAITARGYSAGVIDELVDPGGGAGTRVAARQVVLLDPHGRARELDSTTTPSDIDPHSLILDTHTVLWTHSGAVRYARF